VIEQVPVKARRGRATDAASSRDGERPSKARDGTTAAGSGAPCEDAQASSVNQEGMDSAQSGSVATGSWFPRALSWRSRGSTQAGAQAVYAASHAHPLRQQEGVQQQQQQQQLEGSTSGWRSWALSWFKQPPAQGSTGGSPTTSQQQQQRHHGIRTRRLRFVPKHLGHVFARVDATPLACASIAQVPLTPEHHNLQT
jgi:hypothetical protein